MNLVILDRDGVINIDSDDYIKSPDEWQAIDGSLQAIAQLNHANYYVAIASNQSGIARGLFDLETLNEIHLKMQHGIKAQGGQIDAIFFCPHHPNDGCSCRKPKPGLLLDIAKRLQCNPEQAVMIGDSFKDIQAAWNAGCKPILVRTGKGEQTFADHKEELAQVPVYQDLAQAVAAILATS